MTTPLYIFDLDGTLALIEHRTHLLKDKDDPECWSRFYKACVDDQPNLPVITTMFRLKQMECDIWIWTGRSDEVRQETIKWLLDNTNIEDEEDYGVKLRMRKSDDFTPDDQLKESWLKELSQEDRDRLVAVFEDRNNVVNMWRRNSICCMQVAIGEEFEKD